jgi:hypothetical protein
MTYNARTQMQFAPIEEFYLDAREFMHILITAAPL